MEMKKTNIILKKFKNKNIVEKRLNIPPDYQYKAITGGNFIQANWHRNKLHVINKLIKLNRKMNVLDLGTGSGNFEIFMHNQVGKITGIDYNSRAINFLDSYLLNHNINNVDLIVAKLQNLDRLSGLPKFDLIILIDVVEHLSQPDVDVLMKSLRKLLKKDGRVIFITPNYKSLWSIVEYMFDLLRLVPKFKEEQHLSKHYKSNLKQLIVSNKFKVDNIRTFNLFSYLIPSKAFSKLLCNIELSINYPIGNLVAVVFSKV